MFAIINNSFSEQFYKNALILITEIQIICDF